MMSEQGAQLQDSSDVIEQGAHLQERSDVIEEEE